MREIIPGDALLRPRGLEDDSRTLSSICVYCGSSPGNTPVFAEVARDLGRRMGQSGIDLVYGGGDVGLMGIVARSVLAHGGHVTGIIPDFLKRREHMLDEAQELVVVPDMHTRKQLMFERADAFVALPGGIGTLEELVEQMTWSQLGRHAKPILLLDVNGFWKPLLVLIAHMRQHGFIRPGLELSYLVAERTEDVIPMISDALRRGLRSPNPDFPVEVF
ncbi:TIGR00730 family Rossman fold protein [uncultured Enterovirga sp.]|uniref:LOG family protein n=1 Tax=uncultured Enterovirga sp. TaxID=2026352 RepID=UPI0035CBEC96